MTTSGSVAARVAVAVAILAMLGFGLVTLLLVALETGVAGVTVGLILAFLPLPIYIALALWVDRYEKEPLAMLALALLWGGSVAVFFSYILNSLVGAIFLMVAGKTAAKVGAAVVSAPIVEECAKGAALFLLYFWKRYEFDNVTDGIVYAAMVGLGFATAENVLYYGNAAVEGVGSSLAVFIMRGVISPFSHPLFTAMIGIGLGIAREAHGGAMKWAAPAAGLLLAIVLHALWNLSASLGFAFFVTYLLIMLPFFFSVLGLVAWSLRRERAILRSHLAPYVQAGLLTGAEIEGLASPRARMRGRLDAMRADGLAGWRRTAAFQRAAADLAFHGWRRGRGIWQGPEADAVREREAVERLRSVRFAPRPPVVGPPAG